jgi:hypothetical protein
VSISGLLTILFPHLARLRITRVFQTGRSVRIQASTCDPQAACPACSVHAQRVHSRYERRISDTALSGRELLIHLGVRRFFCDNVACSNAPNPTCSASASCSPTEAATGRLIKYVPEPVFTCRRHPGWGRNRGCRLANGWGGSLAIPPADVPGQAEQSRRRWRRSFSHGVLHHHHRRRPRSPKGGTTANGMARRQVSPREYVENSKKGIA